MRILITNDDGIQAKGIYELARALLKEHAVTVVAPDAQRSACGHAITMHVPLMAQKYELLDLDIPAYAVNGTPADCVKLGISQLMQEKPELVLSGINAGPNIGSDVLYSGTVSGALEGAILGIKSAAFSLAAYPPVHFKDAANFAAQWIKYFDFGSLPEDTMLNINFPDVPINAYKGIVAAPQGITRYISEFAKRSHPRGFTYYWLSGELEISDNGGEMSDVSALHDGKVVISPLRFNLTNRDYLSTLDDKIAKFPLQNE